MIAALVPVKQLEESKSRLLPELDASARERLSLAMLRDVLSALAQARRVERHAVVTPDEAVAVAARAAGAEVVLHREPGLNASLDAGAQALGLGPSDGLLVVLGDVAGATADDLDALCAAQETLPAPCAALAPARDGGTAALLRRPPSAFAARFGPESAKRHREEAERAGATLRELALPSLAIDLDDAEDVRRFLASAPAAQGAGAHTRALLESLGWSGE